MDIIELFIDENDDVSGIEAVSIVENPAIEEDFVALKNQEFKFAEVNKEKRILMGAALIPNKPIYRKNEDKEYYIYFSRDTVRKASELFFIKGNYNKSTLEHRVPLAGLVAVESWIVEDLEKDKSRAFGMEVPLGTWMLSMKVMNDDVWENYVKTGLVKGFSIEGYFADKLERPNEPNQLSAWEQAEEDFLVEELKMILSGEELESFADYPDAVSNNAKRGIELNEKVGNKCATNIGKIRAATLRDKKPLSVKTIQRMYSYLSRAQEYYDEGNNEACGTISYLLWGGKAGLRWSGSKLRELDLLSLQSKVIDENTAIINDRLAYSSKEKAEEMAKDIGCEGIHTHEYKGQTWYMPCKEHKLSQEEFLKYKCPKGYKKDYKKHKCVPLSEKELAEIGPRGGVKKSPKAPKSGTPNKNPKGKGTAKGDASTSRGAKVSKADEQTLQKKSDEFNERYKDKLGYGVTIGKLKAVFQRGLGAFNVSHSPRVSSASQWAFARVNAFLYLVKNGRPQNPKYTGDFDLLPAKHPKAPK
tara:strand:+ start:6399 stop:7988 length:1590 start_codon:yes stop_codon:yes gene_type:complete